MSFQYDELASKGSFSREDIVTMLTAHEGSSDAAFQVSIVITLIIIIMIIVVIMIINLYFFIFFYLKFFL